MACNPSATLTLFGSTTSSNVITSFSQSVSSLPPSVVTTSQATTCLSTTIGADNLTTCVSSSTIAQVNSIPGGVTTIQVPIDAFLTTVISFPTQTLYGSCTSDVAQTTSTTAAAPTTTPPPPKPTPTTFRTMTTPSPTLVTSRSTTTLPNGSALVTTVVVTSSVSPSYVYGPASVTPQTQGDHDTLNNPKAGRIIGGAVGGVFGLLGLMGLVWFILRKRNAWDDIFDGDNEDAANFRPARLIRDRSKRMSIDASSGMEPKPYQYGLIGHSASPPLVSPPGSPTGQHPYHDNGQGWQPDYNQNQPYSADCNQNAQGSGQQYTMHDHGQTYTSDNNQNMQPGTSQQHMMHDGGQSFTPNYNQNVQGASQQHMAHDSGQSYTPNYNQNPQQYLPDHVETLHQRHPSGTSLLYTPLILPSSTRISPEPSVASLYSANSRPGYSRDSSGSRLPLTAAGGSRPSTGGSVGSRTSMNTSMYPSVMAAQLQQQGQRQQRRTSRPDEFGVPRPPTAEYGPRPPSMATPADHVNLARQQSTRSRRTSSSGRPTSPRVLTLTNWNPSTDNISLDGVPRPTMGSPPAQSRHTVNPSVSSTVTTPADTSRLSPAVASSINSTSQAGPSSRSENVILHTDGGRVEESPTAPTDDIKEIPAQAPPAYSE